MMVTYETQAFLDRFKPPEDNSPTFYVLILLMVIDVVVVVVGFILTCSLYPFEGASTPSFIFKREKL
jgi:hypothetical protein